MSRTNNVSSNRPINGPPGFVRRTEATLCVTAVIDLHGYTRDQAIRRLTDFLERQSNLCKANSNNSSWVRVITGTGSHSLVGPVLRTAVEKLLTKRKMEFRRETAGSFLANCTTGIVLYKTNPEYTKVVVLGEEEDHVRMHRAGTRKQKHSATKSNHDRTSHNDNNPSLFGPTLKEVVKEDTDLKRGKEESIQSFRRRQKEHQKEQKELRKALGLSKSTDDGKEEEMLQLAMDESGRSCATTRRELSESELEEAMQEALRQSLMDDEDEMLRRALELSRNHA